MVERLRRPRPRRPLPRGDGAALRRHGRQPVGRQWRRTHPLDTEARLSDFAATGFAADPPELLAWTLRLDPEAVRRLYATYSNVNALLPAARERLLDGLAEIAARAFGGQVERNMVTAIYTARSGPVPAP